MREGVPQQIVTDNGMQFVSREMTAFLNLNGVQHITMSVYYPQNNGMVE